MYLHHFDHEFPESAGAMATYAVCSVPRSGSSLLCELLFLSGRGGAPTEYFDREQMNRFMEAWGVTELAQYVRALRSRKTGSNGIFGVKLHHGQMLDVFGPHGMTDVLGDLKAVSITRDDKVAQAVSYAIALQTNRWASTHESSGSSARFSRSQITRLVDRIEREEQGWEAWYAASGVEPLRVRYDDLLADRWGVVAQVLEFVGADPQLPAELPEPTLHRQADARSRAWAARYRYSRWAGLRDRPRWRIGSPRDRTP